MLKVILPFYLPCDVTAILVTSGTRTVCFSKTFSSLCRASCALYIGVATASCFSIAAPRVAIRVPCCKQHTLSTASLEDVSHGDVFLLV